MLLRTHHKNSNPYSSKDTYNRSDIITGRINYAY